MYFQMGYTRTHMKIKQWFVRSSNKTKAGLLLVATFMVFGGLGFAMRPAQYSATVQGARTVSNTDTESVDVSEKSKITVTKTEIETTEEEVPFATTQTYDGTLPKDTTIVKVEGRNGKKVVRTEVKTKDGEVTRSLISETITVPPVSKVVAIGTKVVAANAKPQGNDDKKCKPAELACASDDEDELSCQDGFAWNDDTHVCEALPGTQHP